ncbi:MAG: hypothetical protein IJ721_04510 [Bacteroidales bacterium]|nr:hypothetical protein [Bacteroidales bacterium]
MMMLLALACNRTEAVSSEEKVDIVPGKEVTSSYFIDGYAQIEGLVPIADGLRSVSPYHFLCFKGIPKYLSVEEAASLRDEIGDNSGHFLKQENPSLYDALVNPFNLIEIVSSSDFNEIPAGASLNEKTWIVASRALPVIDGKGNYKFDITSVPQDLSMFRKYLNTEFYPVCKRVSDVAPEDLYLIWPHEILLVFIETPAIPEHIFTVTLHDGERTYSMEVSGTFNEP